MTAKKDWTSARIEALNDLRDFFTFGLREPYLTALVEDVERSADRLLADLKVLCQDDATDPLWDTINDKPLVGWHGECTWGTRCRWNECVALPDNEYAVKFVGGWKVKPLRWFAGILRFRPLQTEHDALRAEVIDLVQCAKSPAVSADGVVDALLQKFDIKRRTEQ